MTRKTALAFGIGASLILAAGTASANCATEVHALQQQLGAIDSPTAAGTTDMSASGSTAPTTEDQVSESGAAVNPTWSSNDPGEPASHDEQITGSADTDSTMTSDSTGTVTTDSTGSTMTSDATGSTTGTDETGTAVNPTWSSNDPGEPATHDQQVTSGTSGSTTTMPSDTVGGGTITETTRSGEVIDPADSRSVAISSLKKAQLYADAGQEEACMMELDMAKQHLGVE